MTPLVEFTHDVKVFVKVEESQVPETMLLQLALADSRFLQIRYCGRSIVAHIVYALCDYRAKVKYRHQLR